MRNASGPRLEVLRSSTLRSAPLTQNPPLACLHVSCWPSGSCDVRGVMRSAPHRHGSSPKGPLHAAPHSALPRSHKSPPAGQPPRQHAIPVRCRSIPPAQATRPGVRRQARLPGSAPLHRRTPRRPRQPAKMLRTPPPVCAVFRSLRLPAHRAPGKPPHHPQRRNRGGASGGRPGDRASLARALCIELARKAHRASV